MKWLGPGLRLGPPGLRSGLRSGWAGLGVAGLEPSLTGSGHLVGGLL
jgi:hypothetical protein